VTETDWIILLFIVIPGIILCAVIETRREQKEFRKWLREGRWKFEKFKH